MVSFIDNRIIAIIVIVLIAVSIFFIYSTSEEDFIDNIKPEVVVDNPVHKDVVSNIVMISGTASDPNSDDTLVSVEMRINDGNWNKRIITIRIRSSTTYHNNIRNNIAMNRIINSDLRSYIINKIFLTSRINKKY